MNSKLEFTLVSLFCIALHAACFLGFWHFPQLVLLFSCVMTIVTDLPVQWKSCDPWSLIIGSVVIMDYFLMGLFILVVDMFTCKLDKVVDWMVMLSIAYVMGTCCILAFRCRRNVGLSINPSTFSQLRYHEFP